MVTILNYKKITIVNDIYIKVFSGVIVSYHTVSTYDVLNTNNNEAVSHELTIVLEEQFEMKFQEVYIPKYLNFQIFQSPLGFGVAQTDRTMELVH